MLNYNPATYAGRVLTGCSCLALLSLLVLAVLGGWFKIAFPTSLPDWFLQLLFLTPLVVSAWANARIRVVVRAKGLEIHKALIGSELFTTWDNLSHLGIREVDTSAGETGGITYHRLLYLKQAAEGQSTVIDIGSFIEMAYLSYTTGKGKHKITRRIIDPDKLVETAFGQDLLTYAPLVIEAAKQEQQSLAVSVADTLRLAKK